MLFYRTLGYLTGSYQDEKVANFGIYNKKIINAVRRMNESIRYFPTMIKWIGFHGFGVEIQHAPRYEGKTSYNFKKLLYLALNIILAYSDKPIRLTIKIGFYISLISLFISVYYLIKWFSGKVIVIGYASLIISIWFLSGIIIATLGVVGLYIGKTFEQVKNRPVYLISKTV